MLRAILSSIAVFFWCAVASAQTNIFTSPSTQMQPAGYLQNSDGSVDTSGSNGNSFDITVPLRILPNSTFVLTTGDWGAIHAFGNGSYPFAEFFADNGSGGLGSLTGTIATPPSADGQSFTAPTNSSTVWMRLTFECGSCTYPAVMANTTITTTTPYVPTAPTLVFGTIANHFYTDAPFTIVATSNSTGAITYSVVSGPATISGSTVTLTGATGSVTVRASQVSSGNYGAASITKSFTVSGPLTGNGFVSITHNNVADVGGGLLVHGKECFTPVNNLGVAISTTFNTGTAVGTITKQPKCGIVTNGVLQTGFQLVDSSTTFPDHVCYQMITTNTDTGQTVIGVHDGWSCVQPTGSSYELSNYHPNVPGITLTSPGSQGAPGLSAYQVAVQNGYTGTQSQWLASLAGGVSQPLAGKNVMFMGDSISSIFSNLWQNAFITRTGATYYGQLARPGATWGSLLEGYGAYCPLASISSLGTWSSSTDTNHTPQCAFATGGTEGGYGTYTTPQNGYTLAQTLSNVDVLVINLGTNDASYYVNNGNLGTIADGYTAGTEYAAMNFDLDAIYAAKPSIRIVIATPYFFTNGAPTTGASSTAGDGSGATTVITPGTQANTAYANLQAEVSAEMAVGAARGIPVLNMLATGSINQLNMNSFLRDGTHPTNQYMTNVLGPKIANFTIQQF